MLQRCTICKVPCFVHFRKTLWQSCRIFDDLYRLNSVYTALERKLKKYFWRHASNIKQTYFIYLDPSVVLYPLCSVSLLSFVENTTRSYKVAVFPVAIFTPKQPPSVQPYGAEKGTCGGVHRVVRNSPYRNRAICKSLSQRAQEPKLGSPLKL